MLMIFSVGVLTPLSFGERIGVKLSFCMVYPPSATNKPNATNSGSILREA
jgi:hypothetical protein